MKTAVLELPWETPPLSLNHRRNHHAHARVVTRVRNTAQWLFLAAHLPRGATFVTVQLHYRPPDRRRRDTDNLVATLKPICDQLAAGTTRHPGYGLVADDTPDLMAKPEPQVHPSTGRPGRMWLELTWTDHTQQEGPTP